MGDITNALPAGVRGPFFDDEYSAVFSAILALTGTDNAELVRQEAFPEARLRVSRLDFGLPVGDTALVLATASLGIPGAVAALLLMDALFGFVALLGEGSVLLMRGAVARCVECGKDQFPVRFMFGADALQGFERHFPPAVVVALHAREPPGKALRGKGVAGSLYFRLAWLSAAQGHMPPIGA